MTETLVTACYGKYLHTLGWFRANGGIYFVPCRCNGSQTETVSNGALLQELLTLGARQLRAMGFTVQDLSQAGGAC